MLGRRRLERRRRLELLDVGLLCVGLSRREKVAHLRERGGEVLHGLVHRGGFVVKDLVAFAVQDWDAFPINTVGWLLNSGNSLVCNLVLIVLAG